MEEEFEENPCILWEERIKRFNNLEIEGNPEHFEANLRVLN